MRLKALLADDENAVSPVIGVILMVAITVILAAVIASFVLGLGPSDAAPTVNFDSETNDTALVIEVTGGDQVSNDQISVSGTVAGNSFSRGWNGTNTTTGGNTVIQAGNLMKLSAVDSSSTAYDVDVVWTSEDGSSTSTLTSFSN